jgi:sugar phosphate permease
MSMLKLSNLHIRKIALVHGEEPQALHFAESLQGEGYTVMLRRRCDDRTRKEATMGRRRLHWAWAILGICFVNLFINYSVRLGYGVVMPETIRTLGFSRAEAGWIYNCYLFIYISVTPFTGYLTDLLGARRVVTVCLVLLAWV